MKRNGTVGECFKHNRRLRKNFLLLWLQSAKRHLTLYLRVRPCYVLKRRRRRRQRWRNVRLESALSLRNSLRSCGWEFKKKNLFFFSFLPTLTAFSAFSYFLCTLCKASDGLNSFVREVRTLHVQPHSETLQLHFEQGSHILGSLGCLDYSLLYYPWNGKWTICCMWVRLLLHCCSIT